MTSPGDEACNVCETMCAPCQACADSQEGECYKCWHCWNWDDDKLEDDDDIIDHCDALHSYHDWDDAEVRCLTSTTNRLDCRVCWNGEATATV